MILTKKKILITGASGLLGSELIQLLEDYEIHACIRNSSKKALSSNIIYHFVDFNSDWDSEILPKGIDVICHFSQSEDFRNFPDKAINIFRVNIDSTAKLLDYAYRNKVKKFIFASSGGIYGSGVNPFHENSPISQVSNLGYYLGSKLSGEILCQNYTSLMDIILLRFFFMYGKKQQRNMLLPRLVDNVLSGQKITLQGDSGLEINPIHVVDAAIAVKKAIEVKGSHTFNIAGREVFSLKQIAELIGSKVGKKPNFEINGDNPKNLVADCSSMKSQLHSPAISLSQGLDDLI